MAFMNAGTEKWLDAVSPDAKEKILGEIGLLKSKADDSDIIYKDEDKMMEKDDTTEVEKGTSDDDVVAEETETTVEDDTAPDVATLVKELFEETFGEVAEVVIKLEAEVTTLKSEVAELSKAAEIVKTAHEEAPRLSFMGLMDARRKSEVAEEDVETLLKDAPTETEEVETHTTSLMGF